MEHGVLIGLGALVGAILGAAGALYTRVLKAQTEASVAKAQAQSAQDLATRKATMDEMLRVVDLLKAEVAGHTNHIQDLRRQNEEQAKDMLRLNEARAADLKASFNAHEICLQENTKLQKQILLLESTVRKMEAKQSGSSPPENGPKV